MTSIQALIMSNPLIAFVIAVIGYLYYRKKQTTPATPEPVTIPGGLMASILAKLGPVGASIAALLLARMDSSKIRGTVESVVVGILDMLFPKTTIIDPPIIVVPVKS